MAKDCYDELFRLSERYGASARDNPAARAEMEKHHTYLWRALVHDEQTAIVFQTTYFRITTKWEGKGNFIQTFRQLFFSTAMDYRHAKWEYDSRRHSINTTKGRAGEEYAGASDDSAGEDG